LAIISSRRDWIPWFDEIRAREQESKGASMYYPTFDEVKQLRDVEMDTACEKSGTPILPLYCDILADLETPVSAYCKAAQGPYSFLLESVTGGERIGRYSFIGIDPYMVITHQGETATIYTIEETPLAQYPG